MNHPQTNPINDRTLDDLIEKIMQAGFDVAMGGSPLDDEPYDNELAFEKARAEIRPQIRTLILDVLPEKKKPVTQDEYLFKDGTFMGDKGGNLYTAENWGFNKAIDEVTERIRGL